MMVLLDILGTVRLELLVAVCVLLIVYVMRSNRRPKNFPPGPPALPGFGYLPFFFDIPPRSVAKLVKKYGDIFSLQCGPQTVVILSSAEVIKEAIAKPELSGKPHQSTYFVVPLDDPLFGNGESWKEHKRFSLKAFKSLFDEVSIESLLQTQVTELFEYINSRVGQKTDLRFRVQSSLSNYMTSVMFGEFLDFQHPYRKQIDGHVVEILDGIETACVVMCFSWMQRFAFFRKLFGVERLEKLYEECVQLLEEMMKEYKNGNKSHLKCFLNSYLAEMSSKSSKGLETTLSEDALPDTVIALYAAATETTTTTIMWALYSMAVYPDMQRKVQRELDEFYGSEKMPSYSDHKSLPYTEAVLKETLRLFSPAPLGIRITLADTKIGKYDLPKGTFVTINHWSVHRDPRYWREPEKFKPERFLSQDMGDTGKLDCYMPFSVGKRRCAGETMAWHEIFAVFASIVQKYEIVLPAGHKPDFHGYGSIVHRMKKHQKLIYLHRDKHCPAA